MTRLDRAGLPVTVHDFRVEQVLWGLATLALAAVPAVLVAVASPGRTLPLVLLCATAFASGVLSVPLPETPLTPDDVYKPLVLVSAGGRRTVYAREVLSVTSAEIRSIIADQLGHSRISMTQDVGGRCGRSRAAGGEHRECI